MVFDQQQQSGIKNDIKSLNIVNHFLHLEDLKTDIFTHFSQFRIFGRFQYVGSRYLITQYRFLIQNVIESINNTDVLDLTF